MVDYEVLSRITKAIEEQYFGPAGKHVCLQARFACIEENESDEDALSDLLGLIRQEYDANFHQSYGYLMKEAEVSLDGETIRFLLPGSCVFMAMEQSFLKDFAESLARWNGRFQRVEISYAEPEDLHDSYREERVYSQDEHIARVIRKRENTGALGTKEHKPKDLVKHEKKEVPDDGEKKEFRRKKAAPQDPEVFYGKSFNMSETTPVSTLQYPYQEVVINGQIFGVDSRELVRRDAQPEEEGKKRATKTLITFNITDFEDSISCKMYISTEDAGDVLKELKNGTFIWLHGETEDDKYSRELTITRITGLRHSVDFRMRRNDTAPVKRVELHCHTQMSDMDAVTDVKKLVETAFRWGHPAIAITDHGVVQSFVDAAHALNPKDYANDPELAEAYRKFKIIYGCEGYLVDDEGVLGEDGKPLDYIRDKEQIKRLPSYHIIILCKNDVGRNNLYRLVSRSHIDYCYKDRPRIPKSMLRSMREGLIIGSACEAGELFRAILFEKPEEEIKRISDFYDYYEIQPLGNNAYMIDDEKIPQVTDYNDLAKLNRRIVDLADAHGKMCIATCDVHFLNAEDEVYRRIIMAGKGFPDADRQPPLFYRTTDEMLEEFTYLSSEKAYEVVVTNPNRINDMIERIDPVRPDKCPPVIENSDNELRSICYETAKSWYGENLPTIVSERLEKELGSIIKNGFAVMYIIAQRLVKHSNDDGYLVGSRGSVGSSFVATMAGITEVNPLQAHYFCKSCHFYDFDSEIIKEHGLNSGFDLPRRNCPVCGKELTRDGQNIPFETFLGFNGDKEPDIDLNFSSEYQSKAHAYTEVLFGKGHTFRAGTVGTLADKTAYGFIKKYYEEHGIPKRTAEIERILQGCVGVRRSTGQHPGGIIVLPHGEEIDTFTPIQFPANDSESMVTTHFDYHKIDHNLLKLDILGHDDPTMIRMLEDITGIDVKTIPMDDPNVLALMRGTSALGIRPEDIDGCELGSLGLPELGTNFVMKMLQETQPTSFTDMIRISGLSHGTDVWTNNTQDLIAQGKCTLSTAICTRDDIMTYLISMGIESNKAFKIMEKVRKGKGLEPEMEETMVEHNVPDWYIWSCKRIKYMFPKAHACAYVMMAFRVAYFKLYYPLAYYAAYFSIRAKNFNYAVMAQGREHMEIILKEFNRRNQSNNKQYALSDKEQGMLKDMKLVQEMYARGYDFVPIDIHRAKAGRFTIVDGKIMPSLTSIDGLGIVAAQSIEENANPDEPFISKEDIRNRCHVGTSVTDLLTEVGVLGNMQESNQMRIQDFFGELQ
ncbi:MAG: PolC-type DNA polymerase III [Lachnospiraceae bacterium]|nr:PolC-type DNA polymerase III [Lachnospiraceae bacterium]